MKFKLNKKYSNFYNPTKWKIIIAILLPIIASLIYQWIYINCGISKGSNYFCGEWIVNLNIPFIWYIFIIFWITIVFFGPIARIFDSSILDTFFLILVLVLTILLSLSLIHAQTLTYDSAKDNLSSTYDDKNRLLTQSNSIYIYDGDMDNTLTNITNQDVTIKYEYDNKKRIIRETKIIDGVTFIKEFSYDSMDRIVSQNGLDYSLWNVSSFVEIAK